MADSAIPKNRAALTADYILGTAEADLPNAQPLGGLGTGFVYSTDDGTTGTVTTVSTSGLTWSSVAIATQMVNEQGYITTATLDATLPVLAAVGTSLGLTNTSGNFTIKQNALQSIVFNTTTSTIGVGGSIVTTVTGQSIELLCIVANTKWQVLSSTGAVFTIV